MDQGTKRVNGRSVFSLCKEVLDMYPFKKEELDERRKKMSKVYNGKTKLDYESEITHCAYIRSDLTVHACALADFIKACPQLFTLFQSNSQELTIASIGCGPGSDMIGVLLFVSQLQHFYNSPIPILRFALYDSVPQWQKAINNFENVIRRLGFGCGFGPCFEKTFYTWNLTSNPVANFIDYPSFRTPDLFIFSMVFSDVCKQATAKEMENVRMNIQNLCEYAKIGSLFLIIDVCTGQIQGFPLNSFLQQTGFSRPNFVLEFHHNGLYRIPAGEQNLRDLGPYFSENGYITLESLLSVLLFRKIGP